MCQAAEGINEHKINRAVNEKIWAAQEGTWINLPLPDAAVSGPPEHQVWASLQEHFHEWKQKRKRRKGLPVDSAPANVKGTACFTHENAVTHGKISKQISQIHISTACFQEGFPPPKIYFNSTNLISITSHINRVINKAKSVSYAAFHLK